ncbi:sensor histidine kinase [Actinokineospora xionganensis]|uniref:Sensor histidine kinase n=1 Tax=Actinokineospora xionganensis TaxID=2684470 RepID=A0ABR7KZ38_9PSEU|nr:sensor histidine kinase [Actinokineospora xionganensis]MBC6445629.1 sensor histidine kinase [Actinokineospora xionganensis]
MPDPAPPGHSVAFYRDEPSYVTAVLPFVVGGLDAADAVAVAVPQPNIDILRAALTPAASRAVEWIDMSLAGRNPGRIMTGVLGAFADKHRDETVRIVGEPVWPGRSSEEYPACVQHEALIEDAFAGRPVSILCPYDMAVGPAALADAMATHPSILEGARGTPNPYYDRHRALAAHNVPLPVPDHARTWSVTPFDIAALRVAVADLAATAGLTAGRIQDVVLTVVELATNSIEHGSGTATLSLWERSDALIVRNWDAGIISDPLAGRRTVAPTRGRGRGLLLVNAGADLVRTHVDEAGTTIQAWFRRG